MDQRHKDLLAEGLEFDEIDGDAEGEDQDNLLLQMYTGKWDLGDEGEGKEGGGGKEEREKEKERKEQEKEKEKEEEKGRKKGEEEKRAKSSSGRLGARRYWEEEDQALVCFNCNQTGHIRIHCPNERVARPKDCFLCGEIGHIARDCRQNLICHRCNEKGHFARECTSDLSFKERGRREMGSERRGERRSEREEWERELSRREEEWEREGRGWRSEERRDEDWRREETRRDERRRDERRERGERGREERREWKGRREEICSDPPTYAQNRYCCNCGDEGHLFNDCTLPRYDVFQRTDDSKHGRNFSEVYQQEKQKRIRGEVSHPISINAETIRDYGRERRRNERKDMKNESKKRKRENLSRSISFG